MTTGKRNQANIFSKSCEGCKLKEKCTKSERRAIKRYAGDELREAMREVVNQPQPKQRHKTRQAMVEPVFAVLKYQQNLLRFRRRGLASTKTELKMHCAAAYNGRRYLLLSGIFAPGRRLAAFGASMAATYLMAGIYSRSNSFTFSARRKTPLQMDALPLSKGDIKKIKTAFATPSP